MVRGWLRLRVGWQVRLGGGLQGLAGLTGALLPTTDSTAGELIG